jgi:hypothetical protein
LIKERLSFSSGIRFLDSTKNRMAELEIRRKIEGELLKASHGFLGIKMLFQKRCQTQRTF